MLKLSIRAKRLRQPRFDRNTRQEKTSRPCRSASRQPQPRTGTLAAHVLPEFEQLGRASAGGGGEAAGAVDEPALLDEPAEVLLVEPQAHEGFDRPLQLRQREGLGKQLEHDGPIRQLAAQPAEGARRDAAM